MVTDLRLVLAKIEILAVFILCAGIPQRSGRLQNGWDTLDEPYTFYKNFMILSSNLSDLSVSLQGVGGTVAAHRQKYARLRCFHRSSWTDVYQTFSDYRAEREWAF